MGHRPAFPLLLSGCVVRRGDYRIIQALVRSEFLPITLHRNGQRGGRLQPCLSGAGTETATRRAPSWPGSLPTACPGGTSTQCQEGKVRCRPAEHHVILRLQVGSYAMLMPQRLPVIYRPAHPHDPCPPSCSACCKSEICRVYVEGVFKPVMDLSIGAGATVRPPRSNAEENCMQGPATGSHQYTAHSSLMGGCRRHLQAASLLNQCHVWLLAEGSGVTLQQRLETLPSPEPVESFADKCTASLASLVPVVFSTRQPGSHRGFPRKKQVICSDIKEGL